MLELVLETCCHTQEPARICGLEVPAGAVKSRPLKLDGGHTGYAMGSLESSTARTGSIKAYTLAAPYNTPATIGQYYISLASHDMAHGQLDG